MKRCLATSNMRQTRATCRRIQAEAVRREDETRRQHEGIQRAERLAATPLLEALPWVFTSGFLYKHEILMAVSTSSNWQDIYQDVAEELPDDCLVEINVNPPNVATWPWWAKIRGLQDVIPTQAFAKQVFDRVMELKAAAKRSKRQQIQARDAMPKWGIDFQGVELDIWGPNGHNRGGLAMTLFVHSPRLRMFSYPTKMSGFLVRLNPDLCLWTGLRAWRVYDGRPLWDWHYVPMALPLYDQGETTDDDFDNSDDE